MTSQTMTEFPVVLQKEAERKHSWSLIFCFKDFLSINIRHVKFNEKVGKTTANAAPVLYLKANNAERIFNGFCTICIHHNTNYILCSFRLGLIQISCYKALLIYITA